MIYRLLSIGCVSLCISKEGYFLRRSQINSYSSFFTGMSSRGTIKLTRMTKPIPNKRGTNIPKSICSVRKARFPLTHFARRSQNPRKTFRQSLRPLRTLQITPVGVNDYHINTLQKFVAKICFRIKFH